jgi:Bacterial mobilisation protein (MobC)
LNQTYAVMSGSTHLSTWVSVDTKQRFSIVAAQLGLSESAFLKRLIELNLQSAQAATMMIPEPVANYVRRTRFSVRLRPEDLLLLGARASARGMATATYASIVLRTHLRGVAPFPERMLFELKRAVAELGAIGRNLNQIARIANQTGHLAGPRGQDLQALLRACTALRDYVKGMIRANAVSWESGHAETSDR